MLSTSLISQSVRSVVAMLSPEKNPCRIRMVEGSSGSWYRYDPYVSKVIPSPMKTVVSPVKRDEPSTTNTTTDEGLHRNSLFNTPAPTQHQEQEVLVGSSSSVQPKTSSESGKTHYAIIYFKHDSATYIAPFRVKPGDHVVVEGDRGVDVGVIAEITTVTPGYRVPMKIIRRATSKDMEAFEEKKRKEYLVIQQVQQLAAALNLDITVLDTEFQFDNNKLTVFFDTNHNGHIDFRKLQRGLFREHRCRIWLSNMAEVEYNAKLQKTHRTR